MSRLRTQQWGRRHEGRQSPARSQYGEVGVTKPRTSTEMAAAGVTADAIRLVEVLSKAIGSRFTSRRQFIAHVQGMRPPGKLTTQELSRELGGPRRPNGPEWHTVALICKASVKEAEQEATLARWAGLFCVARSVAQPPGYNGEISYPDDADYAGAPGATDAKLTLELNKQSADKLAALADREQLVIENLRLRYELDKREKEIESFTGSALDQGIVAAV